MTLILQSALDRHQPDALSLLLPVLSPKDSVRRTCHVSFERIQFERRGRHIHRLVLHVFFFFVFILCQ